MGSASRGIVRRWGCCSSARHRAPGRATGLQPLWGNPPPYKAQRLSARRMAVLYTFGKPVLRRHVHCALMRSALLDRPPIMPTTACHQRNYVERYSRFIGTLSSTRTCFVREPSGIFHKWLPHTYVRVTSS